MTDAIRCRLSTCRKEFIPVPRNRRYCSDACAKTAFAAQIVRHSEARSRRRAEEGPAKKCAECGQVVPAKRGRSKYCTRACYVNHLAKAMRSTTPSPE